MDTQYNRYDNRPANAQVSARISIRDLVLVPEDLRCDGHLLIDGLAVVPPGVDDDQQVGMQLPSRTVSDHRQRSR
jgi:hypothetical protein